MKKKHQKALSTLRELKEMKDGKLEGGFEFIAHNQLVAIIAGASGANNCEGGNCVSGCGQINTVKGCGTTNVVAGCGAS
jgi:hypothetical protein